jgi:hypothetical protein
MFKMALRKKPKYNGISRKIKMAIIIIENAAIKYFI